MKQKLLSILVLAGLLIFNQSCLDNLQFTRSSSTIINPDDSGSDDNEEEQEVISVGDFFCISKDSSGNPESWYIVSKDTDAADIPQDDVAGIVFTVNSSRIGSLEKQTLANKGVTEPHGLVIALNNADRWKYWGTSYTQIGSSSDLISVNSQSYADINGLEKTQAVWNHSLYTSDPTTFRSFYLIEQCNNGENDYVPVAPSNTTGWYLPAIGNLWDLIENLGGYSLSSFKSGTYNNYVTIWSESALNNLDASLEKLDNSYAFTASGSIMRYCTSSEASSTNVMALDLGGSGSETRIHIQSRDKQVSGGFLVRPILAF